MRRGWERDQKSFSSDFVKRTQYTQTQIKDTQYISIHLHIPTFTCARTHAHTHVHMSIMIISADALLVGCMKAAILPFPRPSP